MMSPTKPKYTDSAKLILSCFLIIAKEIDKSSESALEVIRCMKLSYEEIFNEAKEFFNKNYAFSCFNLALAYNHLMYVIESEDDKIKIGYSIKGICNSFGIHCNY